MDLLTTDSLSPNIQLWPWMGAPRHLNVLHRLINCSTRVLTVANSDPHMTISGEACFLENNSNGDLLEKCKLSVIDLPMRQIKTSIRCIGVFGRKLLGLRDKALSVVSEDLECHAIVIVTFLTVVLVPFHWPHMRWPGDGCHGQCMSFPHWSVWNWLWVDAANFSLRCSWAVTGLLSTKNHPLVFATV